MMGRFARGALLGLLMVFAVGVWPAHADVDTANTKVTSPVDNSVIQGTYESSGPTGFKRDVRGVARSRCSQGFSSIKFKITGPDGYSFPFPTISSSDSSWSGGPTTPWNTQTLDRNGAYSVYMTVTDNASGIAPFRCEANTYSVKNDVRVANAPETPTLESIASSNDPPRVTIKWKRNPEADLLWYDIIRSVSGGPDVHAIVSKSACPADPCTGEDSDFPPNYSGTYSYRIVAYRYAPPGTGEDCESTRCVKSNSSATKSATLTKPTPTPTPSPTDSPTGSPSSSPNPGGGQNQIGGGSTTGPNARPGGSSVLSFGNGGGGGGGAGFNEFYSGTYDTNLPYEPKTLVIGGGKTTAPNGRQVEAASLSDEPPNYRTIMLPVAGGLLAFLSAAHVRRLLIHF